MKRLLLSTLSVFMLAILSYSQPSMLYNCDDFSGGSFTSVGNSFAGAGVFTFSSPTSGEMQIACNVPANSYKMFQVYFPSPSSVDVSGNLPITVTMNMKVTEDVDVRVDLQDNTNYQATNLAYQIQTVTAGSTFQPVTFTFDANAFTGSSPNATDQTNIATFVIYIAHNHSSSYTGTVTFDYMYIGTNPPTSTNKASTLIREAKLYPNPIINQDAMLDLHLLSPSNVKIVLSDLTGKTHLSIEENSVLSVQKVLNTSSLNNGTYVVSYYINNVPEKSELILIK